MLKRYFHIYIVLQVCLVAVCIFFVFRLILFFTETERLNDSVSVNDIFYSFFIGLRFDSVICGYILILPYLIVRKDNTCLLHKYRNKDTKDYSSENPALVHEMKTYAEANMQIYQYLLNSRKQFMK